MWCKQCRQDVPGIVCAESGEYRCPRCAEGIYSPLTESYSTQTGGFPAGIGATEVQSDDSPPRLFDDWELTDRLEHFARVLGSEGSQARSAGSTGLAQSLRTDSAHQGVAGPRWEKGRRPSSAGSPEAAEGFSWMALFIWTVLSLGLMAFVCGAVLLGWSMAAGRQELWSVGLPSALGGQIALLIGLVLQLDRLWHDHRSTAAKVDHFDEELHDLKTTTVVKSPQNSAGTDFYTHLTAGAGPQLLLADLKGQLDLLAVKIGRGGSAPSPSS